MFRMLTAECPRCRNRFHVDADTPDPPAGAGYTCACPRCNTRFPVPCEDGVPQPGETGYAIHATPTPNRD